MNTNATSENCARNCWLIASAIGVMVAMYLFLSADWGFFWPLVVGGLILALSGVLLIRFLCADNELQDQEAAASMASPAPKPPAPTASEPAPEPKTTPVTEAKSVPAPEPEAAPVAAPVEEPAAPEAGAGQPETQPATLRAPREGGADDLRMIKGVGPKLQGVLNAMGYYHFDQIAGWSAADIAWVDENLVGFKGRVSRDDWVAQARALAAGQETNFAKRAKKGGIYD